MINLFQPKLGQNELEEIRKVFDSNWIGKGSIVKEFEKMFAKNLNVDEKYVLSTNSCTEAIFLSADLFNFSEEDEIIIPSISFPSIANSIYCKKAKIVFCDVDPFTLNVRIDDITHLITKKTKAIYITHYGGFPTDMDPIIELCNKFKIKIIEDSACCIKSFYKGKACGTLGDMGMWSLDAMKTLTTGDGGMMYIRDEANRIIAEELLYLGLPIKQKTGLDSSSNGNANWWEFQLNRPGRRAIMNNITASIGISQNNKLDDFIERRKQIFMLYNEEFKKLEWLKLPTLPNFDYKSSYYFYWVQLESRDRFARYLLENDIYSTFRYWPLHKVDLFKKFSIGKLPNSDYASDYTLNIPLHHSLTDSEVNKIVDTIKKFNPKINN